MPTDPALDRALRQLRELCEAQGFRAVHVRVHADGRVSLSFEEHSVSTRHHVAADLHPDSAMPAPYAAMRAAFVEWGREEGEDAG